MKSNRLAPLCFVLLAGCGEAIVLANAVRELGDIGEFEFDLEPSVWCTNSDGSLSGAFGGQTCPPDWTETELSQVPNMRCRNPEDVVYRVNGDQCPPGWTELEPGLFPINIPPASKT